jgi:DNA-binding NarL/FixJ family response regulator
MNILLATKEPSLRLALELLLREEPGTSIVGTASETEGLLALIQTTHPDLVLLDWDLPGRPCAQVLGTARGANTQPAIIVLGKEASAEQPALAAGAAAFVLSEEPPGRLLAAIRRARARAADGTVAQTRPLCSQPTERRTPSRSKRGPGKGSHRQD